MKRPRSSAMLSMALFAAAGSFDGHAAGPPDSAVSARSAPGTTPTTATSPTPRATWHALLVTIGDYADPEVPPLKGTAQDLVSARRMARAMAVPDANVRVLRDRDASGERIRAEIDALARRVQPGDRVFVYYSGHGTRWYDAQAPGDGCTEGLLASDGTVLGQPELARRLAPLARRSDKMLVFYDACFSGGVARGVAPTAMSTAASGRAGEVITPKFTRAGLPAACTPSNYRTRGLAQALQQTQAVPQNVVHVAAARPDQVSFDSSVVGGYATVAWRDCLLGEAQDMDGSGAVTVNEITQCAQDRVSAALAGLPGIGGQQLVVAGNGGFVPVWMGLEAGAGTAPAATPAVASQARPRPRPALDSAATMPGAPTTPGLPTHYATPATSATSSVQATPATPATPADLLAELYAQRDGARQVAATVRQPRLRIGSDTLQLDVTSPRDGHLYVALAGSDGRSLTLLYPNALATDNRVLAGRRVSLPGPGWELVAGGPPGTETLLVLVTDAPRDLSSLSREPEGPFTRTLLDAQGRARLQAVFAGGTPASDCGQPGQPSCSDAFGAALLTVEAVR